MNVYHLPDVPPGAVVAYWDELDQLYRVGVRGYHNIAGYTVGTDEWLQGWVNPEKCPMVERLDIPQEVI
jgi:hypothetical protein